MLGRDAELRTTQDGQQVANLALAYNYGRRGADGKTPTQWIDASFWGERAAKLNEWLVKGAQFYMHVDDVHIETYDKRDGGQGVKLVGRVSNVEFTMGGRSDRQQGHQAPAPAPRPASRAPAPTPRAPAAAPRQGGSSGFDDMDDDIPFADPLKRRAFCLAI